jgi:non-ribosomal peptide synthetase component F
LDEKSGRIAHYLTENGVSSGDMIGVIAKRCIETIINVMGILKSGAAYVPVDPDYPEERKKYIIENSSCKMLIGPEFYRERNVSRYPGYYDIKNDHPNSTAYVIYTSGSTGKPKGVVITHKAVTNTIIDINRKFNVNESDRILGISSMCFDLSVYDVFCALSTGAALVIVPDQRDLNQFD